MLRSLERMIGLDTVERPARFWLIPAVVLVTTVVAFVVIGEITAAPLYVSIPNGVVIALVMAGLAVTCMIPAGADAPPDDPPGGGGEDTPVLGSPGGPWTIVARLDPASLRDTQASGSRPVPNRSAAAGHR